MEFIERMIQATERLLPDPPVQEEGLASGTRTTTSAGKLDEVAKPTKVGS